MSARRPSWSTILVFLGGVVAVNLVIVAVVVGGRADDGLELPPAVEILIPERGAQIRPQDDVGADLDDQYGGTLFIDGVLIPEDQLSHPQPDALGRVVFRPGEGKEFTKLTPGPHRATIEFRPQGQPEEQVEGTLSWTFTAG